MDDSFDFDDRDNFNWITALENAKRGDADYQYKMGIWHLDGGNRFVDIDRKEAVKWLTEAAKQGHEQAKERLAELKVEDDAKIRHLGGLIQGKFANKPQGGLL